MSQPKIKTRNITDRAIDIAGKATEALTDVRSTRIAALLSRKAELIKSNEQIDSSRNNMLAAIQNLTNQAAQLMNSFQANGGAIQDCDHWLAIEGYKPPAPAPAADPKPE